MHLRTLLTLALVACVFAICLEAKSLGKHKKHDKKKHHIKHAKKQDTPDDSQPAEGTAPEPAATDNAAEADDAAADDATAADTPAGGDAPAPAAGGEKPNAAAAPPAPGQQPQQQQAANDANGNGIDDSQEAQQNMNDANGDGIDDRLQQQNQAPAAGPAGQQPAPGADDEEGSASDGPPQVPPGSLPILLGGHMRPGPPSEPNPYPEARYCEAPCPQECAPACYDWCCFNAIQPAQPPVQLMMVPQSSQQMPAASPAPLSYPMYTAGGGDMACPQMPCSAKKTEVNKSNKTKADENVTQDSPSNVTKPQTSKTKSHNILLSQATTSLNSSSADTTANLVRNSTMIDNKKWDKKHLIKGAHKSKHSHKN